MEKIFLKEEIIMKRKRKVVFRAAGAKTPVVVRSCKVVVDYTPKENLNIALLTITKLRPYSDCFQKIKPV